MNRKEFLRVTAIFLGSEVLGCGPTKSGATDGGSDGGGLACTNAITASNVASLGTLGALESGIEASHEHHLTISLADITADQAKSYLHGVTGQHTHSIDITAAQFTQLLAGQAVTTSVFNATGDASHLHSVKLVCG